jgi:hypothetical protein
MKGLGVAFAAGLLLTGCAADFTRNDQSDVILRVAAIAGTSGGTGSGSGIGSVLLSDVSPIFNDNAEITLDVITKSPRTDQVTSTYNAVELSRYEIVYVRSDGRNVEGVDVPFRISGPLALTIPPGGRGAVSIVVVRHAAKEEPPLKNLTGFFVAAPQKGAAIISSGENVITVTAQITVYGSTTSGRVVSASGGLQISFADFADQ